MGARTNEEPDATEFPGGGAGRSADSTGRPRPEAAGAEAADGPTSEDATEGRAHAGSTPSSGSVTEADAEAAGALADAVHPRAGGAPDAPEPKNGAADADSGPGGTGGTAGRTPSRRPASLTLDTARPEGGGRAAPGDAPAPARQWPLLTVLAVTGFGLIVVGTDAFADAFRVGAMLIGVALLTGAVLRRVLPSVGMLAVRSRFTDMVTYGLFGVLIVLLALMAQPNPWLDVPFLKEVVDFTVR